MKRAPFLRARLNACLSLGLGILLSGSLTAQIVTLLDCQDGKLGDQHHRGFYVPSYPGSSMNSVTLYMGSGQGNGVRQHQLTLAARLNTFDGPILASGIASATLNQNTPTAVSFQMISNRRGNPAIPPCSTICFVLGYNRANDDPPPVYAVVGPIGEDLPDRTDPCPNLVQTNGTNPPLSTFRREGIQITITGNKFLQVNPSHSIQCAIDNAEPGDTVTVAPGNYNENLRLRSGVDVQGAGAGETILTGTGTGAVVTATGVNNIEFSGFTVQGSGATGLDAGFNIVNSDIAVRNNIITGNTVGIRTSGSTSFICSNVITGNGVDGGAVDHAIRCSGSDLFSGNRIYANEGGPIAAGSTGAQFVNNTIADNGWWGFQAANSTTTLKNNIISNNAAGGIFSENNSVVASTYNCLFNPGRTEYAEIRGGTITSRLGDILVDPEFDATQPDEYLLALSSPCIDAGDPAAIYNDLDGSRNDIGASGGLCGSETPPGSIVSGFVWTSVGSYANVTEIVQSGAKRGLTTDRDRPFGGHPHLFGAFGNTETAVLRYAVKIAKWSGNTAPPDANFTYRSEPLSKTRFDISGGTLVAQTVALGPTIGSSGIPLYSLTRNSGNIFWAHENLRLQLNTNTLENGTYSVRIEGYNFLGSLVSLTVNQDMIIRVNNTEPVVSIDAVSFGSGAPFDECSIIDLPGPNSTLKFTYTAEHADGFLDNFSLAVLIGRNRSGGVIAQDSYSNHVAANAVWDGVSGEMVNATPGSTLTLLPWETCAYQFRLTAWARTTNGYGRIYHNTFFDNYAIDLESSVICTPDLDGDGDVDAQDLAIMAEAYGAANN